MAPDKNSWQIVGTDINSDAIRPIYLVTGEEAFLVDHCLRNLRRAIFSWRQHPGLYLSTEGS